MKKLLSFLFALVCAMTSFAQTSLMATLNHEGTISTFYGTTALQQAHAAAVSGDVITLSSGTFLSTDITKAVTIRGAGMEIIKAYDIVSEPTVLGGDFYILKSATKPFNLLLACTCPLVTEFADN